MGFLYLRHQLPKNKIRYNIRQPQDILLYELFLAKYIAHANGLCKFKGLERIGTWWVVIGKD
jgi:hypothetical protein